LSCFGFVQAAKAALSRAQSKREAPEAVKRAMLVSLFEPSSSTTTFAGRLASWSMSTTFRELIEGGAA